MTLITLRDVGVAYDGYEALEHVDLKIGEHDFLGVIGPNGGGKTTLVKAILGTIPHSGTIRYAPELFRGGERLIGYMPQISDFDRAFPISMQEVVLSGLQGRRGFRSRYTKEDRAKATALLEEAGIADTARKPIGEVSGGQMQRALLCRAVIADPKLLILDEPTNGLDPAGIQEMRALIQNMPAATGATVLLSSHLLGEMEQMVEQVGIIDHGHILFEGPLTELQRHSRGNVTLRLLDPAKAAPILRANGLTAHSDSCVVTLPPLQDALLADLVQKLAAGGAGVVELTPHTKTLEEIFLSLTSEEAD